MDIDKYTLIDTGERETQSRGPVEGERKSKRKDEREKGMAMANQLELISVNACCSTMVDSEFHGRRGQCLYGCHVQTKLNHN